MEKEETEFRERLDRNSHRFYKLKQKIPAQFIGLNLKKHANSRNQVEFKNIVGDGQIQDKFNQLSNGDYLLSIDNHSRVYLKRDFGSYL